MTCQIGILDPRGGARYFLEYSLGGGATREALVAALRAVGDDAATSTVFAFGPDTAKLIGLDVSFDALRDIRTEKHAMPAAQRDVWVWIVGESVDTVFDRVLRVDAALRKCAELELEVRGFDYHDSHDLIGFEDGTANPKGEKAAAAAVIPEGSPGAGGSFVLTQKWVHDLAKFAAVPVEEQERIIGRTKADSIELEGDAMPADSHVSRTDVKVDGVAMKILRQSSPYGTAREHGLYFVALACEQRRFQIQLERMAGSTGDGMSDRLMEFSKAVCGAYWFAPSAEALSALIS